MKKRVFGKKFSRGQGARKALFKSLIRALVIHGEIKTTFVKAKTVQREVDRLLTKVKVKGVLEARKISAFFGNDKVITRLFFEKIVPVFMNRKSGFTKITRVGRRLGDGAEMARLMWVEKIETSLPKQVGEKRKGDKNANLSTKSKRH